MKKTLCLLATMVMSIAAMAQYQVAILETVDKAQDVKRGVKLLLRSTLATAITNTPGYEALERVDLSGIVNEQKFQRDGHVSDNQIKKIGEATGADYVLIAEVANYDETNVIITAKIINVETFKIARSAEELSGIAPKEMKKSCTNLAAQLLGTDESSIKKSQPAAKPAAPPKATTLTTPATTSVAGLVQLTSSEGTVFDVAATDETERMSQAEARVACSCKGEGWRLPTISELKAIERSKGLLQDISTAYRYWAHENGFTVDMSNGYKKPTKDSVKAKVRCVKSAN